MLSLSTCFFFSFFDEPETLFRGRKQKALLDYSKIMEEKQAGLFPISKRPKQLQERDYFAKKWAAALHNLGTHFTKNLSETDNKFLKLDHKDLILQGGAQPNH